MTEEDRQLLAVYQQAVPQPPRPLSFDDIIAQATHRKPAAAHRIHGWVPALLAACVLLAVAVGGVWLVRGQAGSPISTAKSRAGGSSPPHSSPVSSATQGEGLSKAVGPWSARALADAPIAMSIASGPDAVYGREGSQLVRFDPATGATVARAAADPDAIWPPLITANALWQANVAHGVVSIQSLSPETLQPLANYPIAGVTVPSPQWNPVLAASPDGAMLFLGNGKQLYKVDSTTGSVTQRATVSGPIGALALSADGTGLYAGTNPPDSDVADFEVLDAHNLWTVSQTALQSGPVTGLLPTSGGIWATFSGGHYDSVSYLPAGDISHGRPVSSGGGGAPSTVTLAGGAVWLGGPYTVACADPATGAIRDRQALATQPGQPNYFADIGFIAGRWLAVYQTDSATGLATFSPPARCR